MLQEDSLHWLKVDGVGLGVWRAISDGGRIILTPVPLDQLTDEELIGQTGYIDWRVQ